MAFGDRLKLLREKCCLYTVAQKFQTQVTAVVCIKILVFLNIILDLIIIEINHKFTRRLKITENIEIYYDVTASFVGHTVSTRTSIVVEVHNG